MKHIKSVIFKKIKNNTPLWFRSYWASLYWRFLALVDRLKDYPRERATFKLVLGYDLNLKYPTTFNEKVVWKKLYDRNPLLPIVADKYRCRGYVEEKLGSEEASKVLIPLLYVTDKPEDIPFDTLTGEYIIKPNHASGKLIIVEAGDIVDRQAVITQCKRWLQRPYGVVEHEWAYQPIKRRIVIENLLRQTDGGFPTEYKFHMVHGECIFILVIYSRFQGEVAAIYKPRWQFMENVTKTGKMPAPPNPPPHKLDYMLNLATILSTDFDMVRVDFFEVDQDVYFSELTHYPAAGYGQFSPDKYDRIFGSKWQIIPHYWDKSD